MVPYGQNSIHVVWKRLVSYTRLTKKTKTFLDHFQCPPFPTFPKQWKSIILRFAKIICLKRFPYVVLCFRSIPTSKKCGKVDILWFFWSSTNVQNTIGIWPQALTRHFKQIRNHSKTKHIITNAKKHPNNHLFFPYRALKKGAVICF